MNRPGSVHLIPLACPACGQDLPALEDDVAFGCPPCGRGLELAGEGLADRVLRAVPGPAARSGFHLPFWEFDGSIRVPAFNTREVLHLTTRFSGRPLEIGVAKVKALVGATLSSREAWKVAGFTGLTAPGSLMGEVSLLALPFLDEGNRLLDTITGSLLYKETIDRCRELVAAAQLDRRSPSA